MALPPEASPPPSPPPAAVVSEPPSPPPPHAARSRDVAAKPAMAFNVVVRRMTVTSFR